MNQVGKCVINNFHETTPVSIILIPLLVIDDLIIKLNKNDFEKIMDNFNEMREKVLYMIGFPRLVKQVVDNTMESEKD